MIRIQHLAEVVNWRMCLGCGACAYICPENRVELRDLLAEGIRPVVLAGNCGSCRKCLDVCPAIECVFTDGAEDSFFKEWGPVLEIWEGHATDPQIRYEGASGGALTAISAYCLEVLGMHGALQVAKDPEDPIRNRTRLSRTRSELLSATGSRYSPGSVCNGLKLVETAPNSCVIVGKPSEIAGVRNACRLEPQLSQKVGLTLSFFCAESPSTNGTVALLKKLEIDPTSVKDLRYRGFGWPGHFAPTKHGSSEPCSKMPYRESWAFLQVYRPWSVQLWPDGSGELADISCGDPWYEKPDGQNPGFSLVVVRTERGRKVIEGALAAGYLSLKPAEKWKLVKSQSGLLQKKGSVWGRRFALRLFGLPVTRFAGLDLWHCWRQLSIKDKLQSTVGTVRRVLSRKLYKAMDTRPLENVPVKAPVLR